MPTVVLAENKHRVTTLLEVFLTSYEKLSTDFIAYDTKILDDDGEKGYYELPRGKLIVLLLSTEYGGWLANDVLWTTIRRYTPHKYAYYKALRGQQVKIVITETDADTTDTTGTSDAIWWFNPPP